VKHLLLLLIALTPLSAQVTESGTAATSPAPAASAAPALSATTPAQAEPAAAKAQPVQAQELVTRLQIFLDQQNFGPGIIDGRWGEFTGKALVHYARAHNLQVTPAIYGELPLDTVYPIYVDYTITPEDAKVVGPVSSKPAEEAKLKHLLYPDLLTFIEERYHASPDFLKKLNHGKNLDDLKPGDVVRVPNVAPFKLEDVKEHKLTDNPAFAARSIFISVEDKMLDLYDGKSLIASFPITPGSKALPAPPGVWQIIGSYTLPEFRWDEAMLYHGKRSANFFELPPGPRNPVGILWCGLDKIGIGIHGTSTPETIGRAASHGCIRLANWDAIKFSTMITTGLPVTIE
jgi:lipoprotein-anchoring transpeptidase ErfK/SrfK